MREALGTTSCRLPTREKRQPGPDDKCNKCGQLGHWARECPNVCRSTKKADGDAPMAADGAALDNDLDNYMAGEKKEGDARGEFNDRLRSLGRKERPLRKGRDVVFNWVAARSSDYYVTVHGPLYHSLSDNDRGARSATRR